MKTIRIKFVGFSADFDDHNNLYVDCLKNHYHIEYSEKPQYVFCSMFGTPFEYVNYSGIRIFCSGENFTPDFTSVDYAISFDRMVYTDRYLRMPIYYFDSRAKELDKLSVNSDSRECFCNFIYGHQSANNIRESIYNALNEYKRVNSAGTFMNNMPNHKICSNYEQKMMLLQHSKFTIACESVEQDGFVTEKILHALAAGSIPIYFGSKSIDQDFNPRSFIDYRNFDSINSLVDYIKFVDQNEEVYRQYTNATKYAEARQYENKIYQLEAFLTGIIDQDYSTAFRRPRYYYPQAHEKQLLLINKIYRHNPEKLFHLIYKFIPKSEK